MEAVAKCCQQCILESGRKPTNRDLQGVFWGRYDKYLRKYGTLQHTPQQNGVAERMNRTLKDLVRAMLVHNNVPDEFWAEALCTAAYIRNRVEKVGRRSLL